jgi:hypothetical protein
VPASVLYSVSVTFELDERYGPLLRSAGLGTAAALFDVELRPWRDIEERQNFAIDVAAADRVYRFHLKRDRFPTKRGGVLDELRGVRQMASAGVASVTVVAAGTDAEGRGALLTAELDGFVAADTLLRQGTPFASMLKATADIAGRLHRASLHHRDLYLNHFYLGDRAEAGMSVRLIDAARVGRGGWLTRKWWIVKDLGQFLFSTIEHDVDDDTRTRWLDAWTAVSGIDWRPLRPAIDARVRKIVRHEVSIRQNKPTRNVPLPAGRMNERVASVAGPGVLLM